MSLKIESFPYSQLEISTILNERIRRTLTSVGMQVPATVRYAGRFHAVRLCVSAFTGRGLFVLIRSGSREPQAVRTFNSTPFLCRLSQNKRNSHGIALVLSLESRQFQNERIRGYLEIRTHARPVLAWAYCMPRASCILFL